MINVKVIPCGLLLKASFRVKVAIYTFATTVITLFIAAIGFLWLLDLSMKNIVTVDLLGTTDQLNTSCAASIRFGDEITGAEYLNHGGNQQVLSATLYLPDGSLFAHYDREEQSAPEFPGQTDGKVHFEWNRAFILRPMQENGELIGFLYMVRDLGERLRDPDLGLVNHLGKFRIGKDKINPLSLARHFFEIGRPAGDCNG